MKLENIFETCTPIVRDGNQNSAILKQIEAAYRAILAKFIPDFVQFAPVFKNLEKTLVGAFEEVVIECEANIEETVFMQSSGSNEVLHWWLNEISSLSGHNVNLSNFYGKMVFTHANSEAEIRINSKFDPAIKTILSKIEFTTTPHIVHVNGDLDNAPESVNKWIAESAVFTLENSVSAEGKDVVIANTNPNKTISFFSDYKYQTEHKLRITGAQVDAIGIVGSGGFSAEHFLPKIVSEGQIGTLSYSNYNDNNDAQVIKCWFEAIKGLTIRHLDFNVGTIAAIQKTFTPRDREAVEAFKAYWNGIASLIPIGTDCSKSGGLFYPNVEKARADAPAILERVTDLVLEYGNQFFYDNLIDDVFEEFYEN